MFHKIVLPLLLFTIGCNKKAVSPATSSTSASPSSNSGHEGNPYYSRTDTTVLHVSDADWKKVLPDSVFQVARNKETEEAFTGKYWNAEGIGTYYCAACGNALFRSDSKFASTCGWPSFFETIRTHSVEYHPDHSYGMDRTEVLCGRCGAHLGHLFDDGPPPSGKRYCMNSIVLDFEPDHK
ncbi:MAG: peptide-methionine (R)-S-oxide reductase MsrB [Saprospiraceae bacterium]